MWDGEWGYFTLTTRVFLLVIYNSVFKFMQNAKKHSVEIFLSTVVGKDKKSVVVRQ